MKALYLVIFRVSHVIWTIVTGGAFVTRAAIWHIYATIPRDCYQSGFTKVTPLCLRLWITLSFPPLPRPTGCHGRYGSEGLLRRRRGPEQEGYPDSEVPHRARHHHQLGRHGEDLAPHLLQ